MNILRTVERAIETVDAVTGDVDSREWTANTLPTYLPFCVDDALTALIEWASDKDKPGLASNLAANKSDVRRLGEKVDGILREQRPLTLWSEEKGMSMPTDDGYTVFLFKEKLEEVRRRLSHIRNGLTTDDRRSPEGDGRTFGCLTVFGDFRKVLCDKTPYDLENATQARELLRFLCNVKAQSEHTGRKKTDILEALKTAGVPVSADNWRPAHVFRKRLATLYDGAIGRNATKGLYWINP